MTLAWLLSAAPSGDTLPPAGSYTATAILYHDPGAPETREYVRQLVEKGHVRRLAAERLDLAPDDLADDIDIDPILGSTGLSLVVEDSDQGQVRDAAHALIGELVSYLSRHRQLRRDAEADRLRARLREMAPRVEGLQRQAARSRLDELLRLRLDLARADFTDTSVALASTVADDVASPTVPVGDIQVAAKSAGGYTELTPVPVRVGLVGLASLCVSILLVLGVSAADRYVRAPEAIADALGVTLLAALVAPTRRRRVAATTGQEAGMRGAAAQLLGRSPSLPLVVTVCAITRQADVVRVLEGLATAFRDRRYDAVVVETEEGAAAGRRRASGRPLSERIAEASANYDVVIVADAAKTGNWLRPHSLSADGPLVLVSRLGALAEADAVEIRQLLCAVGGDRRVGVVVTGVPRRLGRRP